MNIKLFLKEKLGVGVMKKIIFVFWGLVLLVTGIVCFNHSKDILPIKTDKVLSIIFQIYPQGFPNFTVSNEDKVLEIVNTINELNLKKSNSQIEDEITIRSSAAEYLIYVASIGDQEDSIEMRYEDENI